MLPSSRRLPTQTYIPVIMRGTSFNAKGVLLKVSRSKDSVTRCSATVSKKVAKTAVARNKLRRRIYSIVATLLPTLHPGLNIIVIAKPGCTELSFKELLSQTQGLFEISGVIPKKK